VASAFSRKLQTRDRAQHQADLEGAEQAALSAHTPRDYTRALVESVTATDSVAFFAEALTLTRRRQDLAPLVERTIERLHGEGLRAYAGQIERHGWSSLRDPDATSRRFWAVAIGVMVEGYAMGRSPDELSREMLRALGEQATAKSAGEGAHLRLVGEPTPTGPNNIAESNVITLPYSQVRASISDIYWQNSWPSDTRTWIAPQLFVQHTFEAYKANRDPVMETILAYP